MNSILRLGWHFALILLIFAVLALGDNLQLTRQAVLSGCCDKAGDANNDGAVNIGDAVWLLNYLFKGGNAPPCPSEGDANADLAINVGDVVLLIKFVFKAGLAPICATISDIDGNVYQAITIGTQVWMAENLKVTHYRNGDPVPEIADGSAWAVLTTGAYCNYSNNPANVDTYGRLYNWYAVSDFRNIAPAGWHVPTDAEWQLLIEYLGGGAVAGGKMKEAGTTHWADPNSGATNQSGFSALPGGIRLSLGYYGSIRFHGLFWSSTGYDSENAWSLELAYDFPNAIPEFDPKSVGFSVRCVKD